jgi:endonuclease/exonuclease/phosphatase family metal-dependent hydrolase
MEIFMNNKIIETTVQKFAHIFFTITLLNICIHSVNAQEIPSPEIKVMTFNVRYGTADDGENSWQYRKDNVFKEIKTLNPDLIGLQEALSFQIDEILKAIPDYSFAGVGRDDGKQAGEYSCILFRKERFRLDTTETFWFSDTPEIPGSKNWGNSITRICTWVKFTDKLTGKIFYHYNLHIDHLSQPSREKSTAFLVDKIGEENHFQFVIVTGDFNCGDENPAVQKITSAGFIDTYRFLHPKNPNEGTFNDFKGITSGEKIDFIFVSKNFKTVDSEIIRTKVDGRYLSDHFPVTAKIIPK